MDAGDFKEASMCFSRLFESCQNSRNIVIGLLECNLQSTEKQLLSDAMNMIKVFMKNMSIFLVNSRLRSERREIVRL